MNRRQLTALLVPLGVVVSHVLAYLLPHTESASAQPNHHHLTGLALFGICGATIAVVATVVNAARGRSLDISRSLLAGAQCAVYVALEVGEGVLSGSTLGDTIVAPTLRTGVVIQLAVAALLVLVLRGSAAVGRRLAGTRPARTRQTAMPVANQPVAPTGRPRFTPASRRGPPVIAAIS